jgi:hypothetical protein
MADIYGNYQNNNGYYYTPPQNYPMQNQQQYYAPQYAKLQYQQAYYKPADYYDTDPAERKKIRRLYNGIGLTLICQVVLMLILVVSMQVFCRV